MKKNLFLVLLFSKLLILNAQQDINWKNIVSYNKVMDIVDDGNYHWIGTRVGLVKYNTLTGEKTYYNKDNSDFTGTTINSMVLDQNGLLWIATTGKGVFTFDGTTWVNYSQASVGLPSNNIREIIIDSNGIIWMATNGGLVKYDGTSWTTYSNSFGNDMFSLAIDANNNIWIALDWDSLAMFDGSNWTNYTETNSSLPDRHVYSVVSDANGVIWIGTFNGIVKIDNGNWTVYGAGSGLSCVYVSKLKIDNNGRLLIGTICSFEIFDGVNWTSYNSRNTPMTNSNSSVYSIGVDHENTIWIGNSGLFSLNSSGVWRTHSLSPMNFVNNDVREISKAPNGKIWLASYFGGSVFNENSLNFTNYGPDETCFNSAQLYNVLSDEIGNVWLSNTVKLFKYTGTAWSEIPLTDSGLSSAHINQMCLGVNGRDIWMATNKGLVSYDGSSIWRVYDTTNSNIPSNDVYSVVVDDNGTVWAGTKQGLAKYQNYTWTIYDSSNTILNANAINTLTVDYNGKIWMGVKNHNNLRYGRGIACFDGTNWTTYSRYNSPINFDIVHDIAIEDNGNVWFATYKGVWMFDGTNWTNFNVDNSSLIFNHIVSIAVDNHHNKWFGTYHHGISVYNENAVELDIENFQNNNDNVIIYPNPTTKNIYINIDENLQNTNVFIYNLKGKKIIQKQAKTNSILFDLSKYPKGIYFLKIQSDIKEIVRKIIIK